MKKPARYRDIIAKHAGACERCKTNIEPGMRALWDAETKKTYCEPCGQTEFSAGGGLFGAEPVASREK